MKARSSSSTFVAMSLFAFAGCATLQSVEHKHIMKGQILDVSDREAVLCIGSSDGAKAEEQFPVYRYEKIRSANPKQTAPSFKREEVGSVQIKEIVDIHYAKASIVSGDVRVHDVAELGR